MRDEFRELATRIWPELNIGIPVFIDVTKNTDVYQVTVFNQSQATVETVPVAAQPEKQEQLEQILKEENEEILQPKEKPLEDDNSYLMIQKRRHRCPECHRFTAETEEKLLRHIKKVHRGENPFNCYMCDYSTYNKSLFEEHVRIHQGIKPFKCSFCPYKSASKKNTKKHELIHRPDNPLKCSKCGFIARHSRSLKCHIKKSCTGMKECDKVKCDECDYVSHDTHIKFHKRAMHKKSNNECSICGVKFKSRSLLRKHESTVHNKVVAIPKKFTKAYFKCKICSWDSTNKPKILLHLIHHPKQKVDENKFDISVLKKFDIM